MAIPKNISKKHIENAVMKIIESEIPKERLSYNYYLLHEGKSLPPKYVISVANKFANNELLDSEAFNAVEAKDFLIKKGFKIIEKKMEYFNQLKMFLSQAKTDELTTSKYEKKFSDLKVKVSFGQGNQAKIPWIAFLNNIDSVQEGIYPVYLYYKDQNLLILAYGVSETSVSDRVWDISNSKTIAQYFSENNIAKPERYGSSFVFKSYNLNQPLKEEEINQDLNNLLSIYKSSLDVNQSFPLETFNYKSFHEKTKEAGLKFTEKIVSRFVASLCTKPFVICSGLSGSGKTKLAQSFVQWICKNEEQYKIVPVGADWTNREPLLGFPNGLEADKYVFPDSGVLQLIINAGKSKNKNKPYFLILDEMNLSHVERYFADFLSIMESQDNIKLYSGTDRSGPDNLIIDNEISWPKNLFIIGTVNIDETTYMFSPKVLDRANVIEFRISESEITKYLTEPANLDMSRFINHTSKQGYGTAMAKDFLDRTKENIISPIPTQNTLVLFFNELRKCGAEFGYRSASEINRLIAVLDTLTKDTMKWDEKDISADDFIDIAIMQKLLPKLHGSRNKLTKILPVLGALCLTDKEKIKENYFEKTDAINYLEDGNIKYKLSFEKICRMYKNAVENGYASYAEA
jgi:5-methylcytosine-specific restriction protein B